MNSSEALGGVLVAASGAAVLTAAVVGNRRGHQTALAYLTQEFDTDHPAAPAIEEEELAPVVERLLRPVMVRLMWGVHQLYPNTNLDRIHGQLLQAGLSTKLRAEEFAAIRLLSAGVGVLLALLFVGFAPISFGPRLLLGLVLGGIAVYAPSAWLNGRGTERNAQISRDLPDMLDLLTISVEAGLGLEAAIESACAGVESPLATELARTLQEMSLGLSRQHALENLKLRVGADDLKSFIMVLTQADALGMPIGRVLRSQADEMRDRRRARAREKAAKLPVKILFPLMLFILPPLFILIMGPAVMSIIKNFP